MMIERPQRGSLVLVGKSDLSTLELKPRPNRALVATEPAPVSGVSYLNRAAFHFTNVVLMVSLIAVGLATGSLSYLLIGAVTETVYLGLVPRSRLFRRSVDRAAYEQEQARIIREREQLFVQMSAQHRIELERLEIIVEDVSDSQGELAGLLLDESAELERLLTSYTRLAIAHRRTKQILEHTCKETLEAEVRKLSPSSSPHSASRRFQAVAARRHDIARRRLKHWEKASEDLAMIEQQLATIADMIELIYEKGATPDVLANEDDELERIINELNLCEEELKKQVA